MPKQNQQDVFYNPHFFTHEKTKAVLSDIPKHEIQRLASQFSSLDPWARLGVQEEMLRGYFEKIEENAPRYAILIENKVAGIIGLRMNWLKGSYLQFLGLLPNYQRLGLGSAALSWIIEEARRHCEQNVWVCASEFNTQALKFYESYGFARIAQLEGLVTPRENEVLLRFRF